jgi:hypothetical protein
VRASPGRLRSGAHVTQGARPVHRALPSRCRPGHCHERQGHEEHCQHSDPRSNRQRRPSAAGARAPPHHRRTGRRDKRLRHAHHQAHGHNGMVIRISATHVLQTSASRSCLGTFFFSWEHTPLVFLRLFSIHRRLVHECREHRQGSRGALAAAADGGGRAAEAVCSVSSGMRLRGRAGACFAALSAAAAAEILPRHCSKPTAAGGQRRVGARCEEGGEAQKMEKQSVGPALFPCLGLGGG